MSLKELHTERQLFEHIAAHLLTQGARAGNTEMCFYRAPNGNKCAVGCVISDEEYHKFDGFATYRQSKDMLATNNGLEGAQISARYSMFSKSDPNNFQSTGRYVQIAVERSLGRQLTEREEALLYQMQQIHDNSYFGPDQWEHRIAEVRNQRFKEATCNS